MSNTLAHNAYAHVQSLIDADRCVMLDGGVATQIERLRPQESRDSDEALWGTWALYRDPNAVYEVHRQYVDAGCHVISTDTWSILAAAERGGRGPHGLDAGTSWLDVARLGIRLARQAVDDAGATERCAVALTIAGEIDSVRRQESVGLLARAVRDDPPDLIIVETLSLIRDEITFPTIELLRGTGIPLWLSFRRCREGVCGVHGQHWGGPEGDLFGRAAARFEAIGVDALLINCLPADHVPGMLPWLRDYTDLPLGVYPNLGYLAGDAWRFDDSVDPDAYAELAREWRQNEGAQIVGGCCGVGPEHIAAAVQRLDGAPRSTAARPAMPDTGPRIDAPPAVQRVEPLLDAAGRQVYPLPFPDLICDPGVFRPTQGSYLVWRHLWNSGAGAGARCLDVGCGCGILAVQLALNGASSVRAIDIDRASVANTLANAYRNGVAERVSGGEVDLYGWEPDERYDVVVASLYQMPVDPFEEYTGHRPLDFWGRNLLDHFLHLLPGLLADTGVAYVMQLSIVGHRQTAAILEAAGYEARAVDFTFFPFTALFDEHGPQIARVEELSDAFHLRLGDEDVIVAYLLEIRRRAAPASP